MKKPRRRAQTALKPRIKPPMSIKQRVELCIPSQMLLYMGDQLAKEGYALRPDVVHYLQASMAKELSGLDQIAISSMAKQIDAAATSLLHDLNPDTPTEGFLTTCMFILLLIDEGLYPDPTNTAVTSALLTMEDAKADVPENEWRLNETKHKGMAGKILSRARLLGYFYQQLQLA